MLVNGTEASNSNANSQEFMEIKGLSEKPVEDEEEKEEAKSPASPRSPMLTRQQSNMIERAVGFIIDTETIIEEWDKSNKDNGRSHATATSALETRLAESKQDLI